MEQNLTLKSFQTLYKSILTFRDYKIIEPYVNNKRIKFACDKIFKHIYESHSNFFTLVVDATSRGIFFNYTKPEDSTIAIPESHTRWINNQYKNMGSENILSVTYKQLLYKICKAVNEYPTEKKFVVQMCKVAANGILFIAVQPQNVKQVVEEKVETKIPEPVVEQKVETSSEPKIKELLDKIEDYKFVLNLVLAQNLKPELKKAIEDVLQK